MISLQNLTPEVYYDQSRDFQLIGRLFDLVLNSVKTEADLIYNLPFNENSSDDLLVLLTLTFGLKIDKNKYTNAQLRALCSVWPTLMRQKGSLSAIETLCNALLRADNIVGSYAIIEPGNILNSAGAHSNSNVDIYIPSKQIHQEILMELLPYILPAGITFSIKQANSERANVIDKLSVANSVRVLKPGLREVGTRPADPQVLATVETSREAANSNSLFRLDVYDNLEVIPGIMTTSELATLEELKARMEDEEESQ